MSLKTSIQWCHSTVNPIMGCLGCELFPSSKEVLNSIDQAIAKVGTWEMGQSRRVFKRLADEAFSRIEDPQLGHSRAITTTNIWHLRKTFVDQICNDFGSASANAAEMAIRRAVTCYAATLHLNKGRNICKPEKGINTGHASIFERVTPFSGRVMDVAKKKDLLPEFDPTKPWIVALPRLVFVSVLSRKRFPIFAEGSRRAGHYEGRETPPVALAHQTAGTHGTLRGADWRLSGKRLLHDDDYRSRQTVSGG